MTDPTTSRAELDAARARLRTGAPTFAELPVGERIALARSMRSSYARVAERTVRAAGAAKGIPLGTPAEGEEWIAGPSIALFQLRLRIAALRRASLEHDSGRTQANGRTPRG